MRVDGLPEVVPPSGRVPGQLLLAALILKQRRRRYREDMGKRASILEVSSARAKYRRRGHRGGPPGIKKSPWRASPWPRHQGAWAPGGGALAPLWLFGKLRER